MQEVGGGGGVVTFYKVATRVMQAFETPRIATRAVKISPLVLRDGALSSPRSRWLILLLVKKISSSAFSSSCS